MAAAALVAILDFVASIDR